MPFLESLRLSYFKEFKFRHQAANKSTIIHKTTACIRSDMQPLKFKKTASLISPSVMFCPVLLCLFKCRHIVKQRFTELGKQMQPEW